MGFRVEFCLVQAVLRGLKERLRGGELRGLYSVLRGG